LALMSLVHVGIKKCVEWNGILILPRNVGICIP
jgi:hypothetical protein